MKDYMVRRIIDTAYYTIEHRTSTRETAKALNIPKTVVHEDLRYRLPHIDGELYKKVDEILEYNRKYKRRSWDEPKNNKKIKLKLKRKVG